jgi:hypothetical protein
LVTSSKVKRTPARENRIRADNVALMAAATIRVQQAGGTRIALERSTRSQGEKRGRYYSYLRSLPPTPMKISAVQRPR